MSEWVRLGRGMSEYGPLHLRDPKYGRQPFSVRVAVCGVSLYASVYRKRQAVEDLPPGAKVCAKCARHALPSSEEQR